MPSSPPVHRQSGLSYAEFHPICCAQYLWKQTAAASPVALPLFFKLCQNPALSRSTAYQQLMHLTHLIAKLTEAAAGVSAHTEDEQPPN